MNVEWMEPSGRPFCDHKPIRSRWPKITVCVCP